MLKARLLLNFFLIFFLQQAVAHPVHPTYKNPETLWTIDNHFQQIRYSEELLTDFFATFPKGGDLHNHFMGSPSPSALLDEGISQSLCLDKDFRFTNCTSGATSALNVSQNYQMALRFKQAMVTTELNIPVFVRHADFFKTFGRTLELYNKLPLSFMNNLRQRAARETLYYIESTTFWSERDGPAELFTLLNDLPALLPLTSASMTEFMNKLSGLPAFQQQINNAEQVFQNALNESDQALNCHTSEPEAGCEVTVRFLHEAHRTNTPEQVFAQLIFSFYLAQQSRSSDHPVVLGINIVGAEDDYVARRDYGLHMTMLSFLKNCGKYPLASITLHAGEMTKQIGSFLETSHSLSEAVTQVSPKRIGHGVSLAEQYCSTLSPGFQTCAEQLANEMSQKNMALEIPYTSNRILLGTTADTHPLPLYLKFKVPVVLATDDPGVLKTDLTSQFVQIAYLYPEITFNDLLTMARNSLEYSLIGGKSLWQYSSAGKPDYSRRVKACAELDSDTCRAYAGANPKASLQVHHELLLEDFINKYGGNNDLPARIRL